MLGDDATIALLREIPLFAEFTKSELREIASVTGEVQFAAGAALIREGDDADEAFVVVDGRLEVTRLDSGKVAELGPGEVVGEMALLSSRPRNATVTAVGDVRALRADGADFVALLDRMPLLWLKVARSLAERIEGDEYLSRP